MKRFIDFNVSLIGLLVLAPVFAVVAVVIKLDSPGPVFFRQERVGRGMRRFLLYKFRTMRYQPHGTSGSLLTVDGDPRITRFGAFVRKAKLDEFPQLLNVLRGDMSLVGPRPEVPKYVELFRKDYEIILSVRPGLTDPASFKYRNEGELLRRAADPEHEYVERILPDKIRLAKNYVAGSNLSLDMVLITKTLLEAVGMEAAPLGDAVVRHRRPLVVVVHLLLIAGSYYLAWNLRFDGDVPAYELGLFWRFLPWLVLIRALVFVPFRLYEGLWRYTGIWDEANIVAAVVTSSVPFVVLVRVVHGEIAHPRSVFIVDAVLLIALTTGVRLLRRAYHELAAGPPGARVVVFGAGDTGESIICELKKSDEYRVVALMDDDPRKKGRRIHGVRVLGGRSELPRIVAEQRPSEILIAIDAPDAALLRDLVRMLEPFSVKLTTLPERSGALRGRVQLNQVRDLHIEDLLSRPVIGLDRRMLAGFICGRRVLVTGAGGSIGSELCRQIARLRPASLVMLDHYENSLHAIRLEMEDRRKGSFGLHPVVADVTDTARISEVLGEYQPEIVFHAAAHKHVPLMEENPCEAIKNNVRGTRLLAHAADAAGVDRFIMISTDKAVNPTSVMGASKRVAEMVVHAQAEGSGTTFSVVRFGNVLGSNGSVVPRFMDQIKRGGPVTITHPEMKRFFMLIPEAVQLVLHAAAQAEGGATYVLDMGEQVNLLDMARDLIRLSGLVPEDDIKIEFIGLRPGEKLYEELVGTDEDASPSAVDKVLCVRSRNRPAANLVSRVEALEADAAAGRTVLVLAELRNLTGMLPPDVASPQVAIAETAVVAPPIREAQGEQKCPNCDTGMVHRSRAKSVRERIKKEFTSERIYRCRDCGWRGWLTPLESWNHTAIDAPPEPDLQTIDTITRPAETRPTPSFSPRNLG